LIVEEEMGNAALKIEPEVVDYGKMSVEQAAAYITKNYRKIAAQTLYNKLSRGEGPHGTKVMGQWTFKRADLDSWVGGQTTVRRAFSR
jgi:hypothetical protein